MSPRKPKPSKKPTSKPMKADRASRPALPAVALLPPPPRRPTFRAQGVGLPSEEEIESAFEYPEAAAAARAFIAEHGTQLRGWYTNPSKNLGRRRVQAAAPELSDMDGTTSTETPSSPSSDASMPSTPPPTYVPSRTTPPPAPGRHGQASGAGLFADVGQPKSLAEQFLIARSPSHDTENRDRTGATRTSARGLDL